MAEGFFDEYISSITNKFSHDETSEMGYRTDFEILIKEVFRSIKSLRILHDARATQGNKPDFIVLNHDVPILYIEAKDIGVSLDKIEKSEQMARYFGYTNLVLTNYVEFRFYRNGLRYEDSIKIADYNKRDRFLTSIPENYEFVANTLLEFTQLYKEPIKSGKHLAKIMGGKAQRIRDNLQTILENESTKHNEIYLLYETLKKLLVHDLTPERFADLYAQTLIYGLFVARYYDESPESFTRQEAKELVPASNPFLGHFFDHITGRNFEKRLEYIIDELCEVFSHADVKKLMTQYFINDRQIESHRKSDPVIHFYEDFLKEYDEVLRKRMGAYYTPMPVVRFIVNAVDCLLQKDFGLTRGIADVTKNANGLHKVQILDPAVGTGTFISEIIDIIRKKQLELGQKGGWVSYVHHELLPRLYGFELMMAPYTIAHLKITMKLNETGFKYFNETRFGKARLNVYLTNSLEDAPKQQELLAFDFGAAIAQESKEASKIKNEKPIMVVVGNPPYSISSSNKGEWIQNLIKDYKKDLNERKINLDDDYIKFIRFSEYFIEKNKNGIVAMITNNSFIDGITHRQMRKHLLETFDDIYILDLHGSATRKEMTPDGGKDENVFDIQQGVAISIFVRKNTEKQGLGKVHHSELFGKRENKFQTLEKGNIQSINWKELEYSEPYYFFVPKDFGLDTEYEAGFKVNKIYRIFNSAIKTDRNSLFIDIDRKALGDRIQKLLSGVYNDSFKKDFRVENSGSYKIKEKLIGKSFDEKYLQPILYRPFDYQWIYYDPSLISRPADKVMTHMVNKENVAFVTLRVNGSNDEFVSLVTNSAIEKGSLPKGNYTVFPLYLYNQDGSKCANLEPEIVKQIELAIGKISSEDIFDYIYAVLYSPSYREKYKEFLKIDFPRVPYPKNVDQFKKLAAKGKELRELHLMESPLLDKLITTYPEEGDDVVEKIEFRDGKVYINSNQYFGNVPEVAWNFYIGGYQPAQKWLKDRKERILTSDDIEHYQKIIIALTETDRIMKEIDKTEFF